MSSPDSPPEGTVTQLRPLPLTHAELNVLLNSWPAGCKGHEDEEQALCILDELGEAFGYGAIAQLAQFMREVQCDRQIRRVADFKRKRFKSLEWPLPAGFEEVARKEIG